MEEIKLLNEVIIFAFFEHKISLASKNYGWRHMDYFNNVLTTFLDLELGGSLAVYGGTESSRILLKIS